jgi:glycosidase
MKLIRRTTFNRMKLRLGRLYGRERAEELSERLYMLIGRYGVIPQEGHIHSRKITRWSERDAVLITYGDMVTRAGELPLDTLKQFCDERLKGSINCLHLLPFFPSSSDGGFSVMDYWAVDQQLGTWAQVERISRDYGLMVDIVLNHCSRQGSWFRDYVSGIAPQKDYFQEGDPEADLSMVTRPRPWPLLTPTETSRGLRHVWTTFSEDQVDLNWKSPDVLFEFLDILLTYVSKGARFIRLDAVAFLWKKAGTSCVHLPETHEVVKLMRDVLVTVAPEVVLITETNVPHEENVSYFGRGDEAHMVYQFALPPLLLHGLLRGDSSHLQGWAGALEPAPRQCTFLNFTASHDGIGVRPLEGLVPEGELEWLVAETRKRGGRVSERSLPDGSRRAYELNTTYRDALSDEDDHVAGLRRFICSQTVMLALQGVPALYFQSLVGGKNWNEGADKEDGENRDLNRQRWEWEELASLLDQSESPEGWILTVLLTSLRVRAACPAFHPDAPQEILETAPSLFALKRTSLDGQHGVVCVSNFTGSEVVIAEDWLHRHLPECDAFVDLLTGAALAFKSGEFRLEPYQCCWAVSA